MERSQTAFRASLVIIATSLLTPAFAQERPSFSPEAGKHSQYNMHSVHLGPEVSTAKVVTVPVSKKLIDQISEAKSTMAFPHGMH